MPDFIDEPGTFCWDCCPIHPSCRVRAVYPAFVIDAFARRVVGWHVCDVPADLALDDALEQVRGPGQANAPTAALLP